MKSSNSFPRLATCCFIMVLCFTKAQAQSREEQVLLRTEQASRALKSLYAKLRQEVQDQQIGGRKNMKANSILSELLKATIEEELNTKMAS